jgi:hypothetical protein
LTCQYPPKYFPRAIKAKLKAIVDCIKEFGVSEASGAAQVRCVHELLTLIDVMRESLPECYVAGPGREKVICTPTQRLLCRTVFDIARGGLRLDPYLTRKIVPIDGGSQALGAFFVDCHQCGGSTVARCRRQGLKSGLPSPKNDRYAFASEPICRRRKHYYGNKGNREPGRNSQWKHSANTRPNSMHEGFYPSCVDVYEHGLSGTCGHCRNLAHSFHRRLNLLLKLCVQSRQTNPTNWHRLNISWALSATA